MSMGPRTHHLDHLGVASTYISMCVVCVVRLQSCAFGNAPDATLLLNMIRSAMSGFTTVPAARRQSW